jgi:NAD(P)-dependent dehydrogenase (short-subunit alcohol dehydrogenase family)
MSASSQGAVVVTGASTGIGRVAVLLLANKGYRVFAGVRREEDARSLDAESSHRVSPLMLDVTDPCQITAAGRSVAEALGPEVGLKALVNNAGVIMPGPLEFMSVERVRKMFEVNTIGMVAVSQQFLPLLRKGRGRIVNVSTTGNAFALPLVAGYQAAKAAQDLLSQGLRRELMTWDIPVSIVKPLVPRTPMWDKGFREAQQTIDDMPADGRELYGPMLQRGLDFMHGRESRGVPPDHSARLLVRAVEDRRPKNIYFANPVASVLTFITRNAPAFMIDWAVHRFLFPRK